LANPGIWAHIRTVLQHGALQLPAGGQLAAMAGVRTLARPMLSSIFIVQGLETMQHPEMVAPRAETVVQRIAELVPAVPADTERAVRINGAVQLTAGTMLGLGWFPRLSALALAGTLVPTTLAGHRFWEAEDPQERKQQRIHFLKNLSMLGGLLIAAVDTDGSPSLAWRRRRASRAASARLSAVADMSDELGQAARAVTEIVSAEMPRIIKGTRLAAGRVSSATQAAAGSARDAASDQLPRLAQAVSDSARTAADQVSQAAQTAVAAGRERARQLAAT
jgi:putative oxidoreductase